LRRRCIRAAAVLSAGRQFIAADDEAMMGRDGTEQIVAVQRTRFEAMQSAAVEGLAVPRHHHQASARGIA